MSLNLEPVADEAPKKRRLLDRGPSAEMIASYGEMLGVLTKLYDLTGDPQIMDIVHRARAARPET